MTERERELTLPPGKKCHGEHILRCHMMPSESMTVKPNKCLTFKFQIVLFLCGSLKSVPTISTLLLLPSLSSACATHTPVLSVSTFYFTLLLSIHSHFPLQTLNLLHWHSWNSTDISHVWWWLPVVLWYFIRTQYLYTFRYIYTTKERKA